MFKEVAGSDLSGLIFTYVWAFDQQEDWDFVESVCAIFKEKNAEVCFVELEADPEERLKRNVTPHRLAHKATKRDIEQSEKNLRETMDQYRLNSNEGEIAQENYIRIDNTKLTAAEVAIKIKNTFDL